jgi:hypothetical protein
MTDNKKCPKGQILKKGYTTKKGTKVKPTCIKDKGKPGKGPTLFNISKKDEGLLGDYGYELKISHEKRVKAIKKSIKVNGELKVLRFLNAIRTLNKSNERYFNKLDKDVKWVQKNYFS